MRTPVSDLKPGPVSQAFLLAQMDVPKTKAGKPYLRGMLRDASGSVTAISFEPSKEMLANKAGTIAEVKGVYSVDPVYGPQVKLVTMSPAVVYDINDFAETCPNNMIQVEETYEWLLTRMRDSFLMRLIAEALAPEGDLGEWRTQTAATTMHQAYRFGLMEHSVQVAHLAFMAGRSWCPEADTDILIAAGLLHDIGKIVEYDDPITRQMTTEGKLFGNTTLSYVMARDLFRQSGERVGEVFDRSLEWGILHAILAHHGRKEWGSPVEPQTIEALLVHHADQLSSRIGGYQRVMRDSQGDGDWSAYDKMFGSSMWLGHQGEGE